MPANISDSEILSILGEKTSGNNYRCPVCHARRGVSVTRKDGKLLVRCHANGCKVWSLLRKNGGAPSVRVNSSDDQDNEAERIREAKAIWERACASDDKPIDYLKGRGINSVPPGLKMLSRQDAGKLTGRLFPTIVAAIKRRDEDGVLQVQAVHLTFLTRDGRQKIAGDRPRVSRGLVKGGAISLGKADQAVVLGEGIENVLSVRQITGLRGGISAVSAGNMKNVELPESVKTVIIAADNDKNGTGKNAAEAAALVFTKKGIKVRIAMPHRPDGRDKVDWNDEVRRTGGDKRARAELKEAILNAPIFVQNEREGMEARLHELAKLEPLEYERQRKDAAGELGFRTTVLDREVAKRREVEEEKDFFAPVEPWDKPVDGDALLARLGARFDRYVVLPAGAATVAALWVLHTYTLDAFTHSPFLTIRAPTKRCGKTTLLKVLIMLVQKPLPAANITPAAVFRVIEKLQPTLLIDELETFLKEREELRGILNSGHERQLAFTWRCVGDDKEPTRFSTWAAKAVALNGRMHPTLEDRSIIIELARKLRSEKVEKVPKSADAFAKTRRMCARWAADNIEALRAAEPEPPDGLNDRACDNWDPLLAVADIVGGEWPDLARKAAMKFSGVDDDETHGIMLLDDLRNIFNSDSDPKWPTNAIIEALTKLEDRPWGEHDHGKPMTPHGLSKLLVPFKQRPKQWRVDNKRRVRGYTADQFGSVFKRYLPKEGGSARDTVTPVS